MYRKNKSINGLKNLKYRNIYIKIDRNRMLDIVIHYSYVWNLSLRLTTLNTRHLKSAHRFKDRSNTRNVLKWSNRLPFMHVVTSYYLSMQSLALGTHLYPSLIRSTRPSQSLAVSSSLGC
jgi:hypothetical protein